MGSSLVTPLKPPGALTDLCEVSEPPPDFGPDCQKLCRCRVRLRALYLAFGLKPIVPVVTVCSSALLVKFIGTLLNLLLNRDQGGRLVRLRCEC